MPIYSWGMDSPITHAEIRDYGKSKEAVLHFNSATAPGAFASLPGIFFALGYSVFPHQTENGETVLRIRGTREDNTILAVLEQTHLIDSRNTLFSDFPKAPESAKNVTQKFRAFLKKKSLFYTGMLYLLGDVALAMAGYKHYNETDIEGKQDKAGARKEMATSAIYASTGIGLVAFGYTRADKAFRERYDDLLKFFAKEGALAPDSANKSHYNPTGSDGVLRTGEKILRKHPAEFLNAVNITAGYALMQAGLSTAAKSKAPTTYQYDGQEHYLETRRGGNAKAVAGGLVIAGMTLSLVTPEKAPDPHSKKKGFAKLWERMQANPEGIGGVLAILNNVAQTVSAFQERQGFIKIIRRHSTINEETAKKINTKTAAFGDTVSVNGKKMAAAEANALKFAHNNKNNYRWNLAAAAIYLIGNTLLALSPKGSAIEEVEGSTLIADDLLAVASQQLANQPEAAREQLLKKTAYKLSEDKIFKKNASEIEADLHSGINALEQGPFSKKASNTASVPQPDAEKPFLSSLKEQEATQPASKSFIARTRNPTSSYVEEATIRVNQPQTISL